MLKRTPSQKKIMMKVHLVDVVFAQEVQFNVAITPGEVEGTVEVPISELERLSQWKEVNWRNLLFLYEKEVTWSSRSRVIQMREPISPYGAARITVWQLHDEMRGYAGPLSAVDPLCVNLCPNVACSELFTLFEDLGLLSSPHVVGDPILPPVGNMTVPPPPPPAAAVAAAAGPPGADDHVNPQQQPQDPPAAAPPAEAQPIWQVLQLSLALKLLFFYLVCQRNRHLTGVNKQGIFIICCLFYFYRVGLLDRLFRYFFGGAGNPPAAPQQAMPRRNVVEEMRQFVMRLIRQGPALPGEPGVMQDAQAIVTAFLASLFPNWQIEVAAPPPPPQQVPQPPPPPQVR